MTIEDGLGIVPIERKTREELSAIYETAPPDAKEMEEAARVLSERFAPLPPDWVHPQRTAGIAAGRNHAGDEAKIEHVIEYGLACALDESQPDDLREKSAEYALGFAQGWHEIMMVQPLFLLTRQQTARVNSLPRRVRRAWLAEYGRGVRQWQRAGGNLSGRRPVLPEIP